MPLLNLADTCRLYYQFYDSAKSKPVVVFLNGTTQTTKSWGMQAKELQDYFRILLYDARGQGQSDLGVNDLTIDGHVDDLIQLLDCLDVNSAHVVGLSHGARVACELGRIYPERTDKMILCGLGNDLGPRTSAILESWYQILKSSNLETLVWAMLPVVFGEPFLEKHRTILNDMVATIVKRNRPEAVEMHLRSMAQYLSVPEISAENYHPTLIVTGKQDVIIQMDQIRMLAKKLGAHLIQLKGVGHSPNIEAPGAFNKVITQFLSAD